MPAGQERFFPLRTYCATAFRNSPEGFAEKAREYYQEALDKGVEEAAEFLESLEAGE